MSGHRKPDKRVEEEYTLVRKEETKVEAKNEYVLVKKEEK
jgi:hypothetical protein